MVKRALLIAFHYPPVKGSSGVQRALKFSTYLAENGWECDVLTVWPRAYEQSAPDELADIPGHIEVNRAIAFDAKRHLSLFGSYPQFLALPDRWATWQFDAVRRGAQMIRRKNHQVLWSTFPIATAHTISLKLAHKFGLPWVADCRDSMTEEDYPRDPHLFRSMRALENKIVHAADAVTFTAPGALRMYAQRYPDVPPRRWRVIQNGYDENAFAGLTPRTGGRSPDAPLVLVHAGLLYPSERDPLPFFRAVQSLKSNGILDSNPLRIVLRATGHDEHYVPILKDLGIDDVVRLEPGVPYRDALQEMLLADGLLLFQAANCNHQIPAKLYEYMRAGRPVLALTDSAGDTAALLRDSGYDHVCQLDDAQGIERQLTAFIQAVRDGTSTTPAAQAQAYSRRAQTTGLAALFDELTHTADK